ncbi:MAG: hypothetical protein GXY32_07510 [Ruminococcaceae bacterium]|nr:hypothetical protein [Oscillospiraceae bacterium]
MSFTPAGVSSKTVKWSSGNTKIGMVNSKTGKVTINAKAKKGHTFAGWYDGKTKVSSQAAYKYKVVKNVTLTAKFTKD